MSTSRPDATDKQFGRYHLVERLGAGAMGAVYRARDASLGREVAVKTIHTLGRSEFQLEMFHARFDNEARALAALSHPNVVNVFDVGVEDGTPFLVMELVEGRSLADRLEQQGCLSPDEACALGWQLAGALGAAHARGIVHRDVKPGNVLEADTGVWKLADFGVAHVPESSLTLTGQFLGSPAYAAPEALGLGEFGPASDVYSLGATLYEALAGTPPFGAGGLLTVGALAQGAAARPIAEICPATSPQLARAVMGAIEREPARRFTAQQLADALAAPPPAPTVAPPHVAVAPIPSRRGAAIGIAVAMLVVGISLGVGLSGDDETTTTPAARRAVPDRAATPFSSRRRGPPAEKDMRQIDKQWDKVDKKLRKGKGREALEHLDEILRRDPGDEEARSLYRQIAGEDWEQSWENDWDDDD